MSQSHEVNQIPVPGEALATTLAPDAEELLKLLRGVTVQLQRMIDSRPRESLQQPGHDGHWGVIEVLCYLRDWEVVIHERIRRVIDEDAPHLGEPDTTMWPLDRDYGSQDSHAVFEDQAGLRESLIGQLREMDQGLWERTGVFEAHGEMTLRDYLGPVVAHDQRYVDEAWGSIA